MVEDPLLHNTDNRELALVGVDDEVDAGPRPTTFSDFAAGHSLKNPKIWDMVWVGVKHFYVRTLKVRSVYLSIIAMAVCMGCGMSLGLEATFAIYARAHFNGLTWLTRLSFLMGLPTITMITAIAVSELLDVAEDAQNNPRFRRMASNFGVLTGRESNKEKMAFVYCISLFIEACWVGPVLWNTLLKLLKIHYMNPKKHFSHAMIFAICGFVAISAFQTCMKIGITWKGLKEQAKEAYGKNPKTHTFDPLAEQEDRDGDELTQFEIGHRYLGPILIIAGFVLLFLLFILQVTVGSAARNWTLGFLIMIGSVIIITFGVWRSLPLNSGFFVTVILFFVVGFGLQHLVTMAQAGNTTFGAQKPLLQPGKDDLPAHGSLGRNLNYPICDMHWGSANATEHLTAIDLSVFADVVYGNTSEDITPTVLKSFEGTALADIEVESVADKHHVGRWAVFKVEAAKTRIFAIRGSTIPEDWMANAYLWASVFLMQFFSNFVPMNAMFEPTVVHNVNAALSIDTIWRWPPIWSHIEQAAQKALYASISEDYDMVITGHSLGGGLAQIIASKIKVQALVFSPVGTGWSSKKFGLNDTTMLHAVTAVVPENDLVPMIDKQMGFRQTIACREESPIRCHFIRLTACELFQQCGDPRQRSMNCTEDFIFR